MLLAMDANVGALSKNLTSSDNSDDSHEGPDHISSLSKDILTFIVSRLPTKEAVQTSVLSTTWVDIWKFMSKVEFDDDLLRDISSTNRVNTAKFVNFVNGVLLHLDLSTLQDFSMKLSNRKYDPYMLASWISSVLKERLQNLYIYINADVAFISSRSLAKCNFLVNLELDMKCTIKFPSKFSLQNLQVFRFERVRFVKNASPHSDDINFSFPSLKVFETTRCVCFNIILHAPKLESFSFILYDYGLSNDDLDVLQKSSFKIYCSPSTTFSYQGHLLHNFIPLNPSAFDTSVELLIDEYLEERVQNTGFRWHMLIKHFSEVESLKLKLNKLLQQGNDYYFASLPMFGRLVYLEVDTVGVETMLNILKNSNILNTLVVKNATLSFEENVVTSTVVPSCFQSNLKDVQFKKIRGTFCELTLVKFVLKNAVALEKMTISPHSWLHDLMLFENVKREILSFPRRSGIVSIEF